MNHNYYRMPKKTLIVLPDINDIQLFKNAGQEKSNNDEYNKIRENVLTNMFNIDDEYFNKMWIIKL